MIRRSVLLSALLFGAQSLTPAAYAADSPEQRSMGGGRCEQNIYNCADTPNPLPETDSVWLDEMTWMDVRDAIVRGTKTVIVPTGGVEPNGPWVVVGKHNFILRTMCDAIARRLGDALCAPVVRYVPNGGPRARSGFAVGPGTISVSAGTYKALVSDVARSLHDNGFQHIIFISDNGGANQNSQVAVAKALNEEWQAPVAHYIPEYYESWAAADRLLLEKGLTQKGVRDGLHDDPSVTALLMVGNPEWVRWKERVAAGEATIDGVSIADKDEVVAWGMELIEARTRPTVAAIHDAISSSITELSNTE